MMFFGETFNLKTFCSRVESTAHEKFEIFLLVFSGFFEIFLYLQFGIKI